MSDREFPEGSKAIRPIAGICCIISGNAASLCGVNKGVAPSELPSEVLRAK